MLGVKMVNTGGTILSGVEAHPSVNRGRMRALLLSSALATVLAGVIQPGHGERGVLQCGFSECDGGLHRDR